MRRCHQRTAAGLVKSTTAAGALKFEMNVYGLPSARVATYLWASA